KRCAHSKFSAQVNSLSLHVVSAAALCDGAGHSERCLRERSDGIMKRNGGFQVRRGNLYIVFLPARSCAEHVDFGPRRSMAELGVANVEFTREPKPFEEGPVFRRYYSVGPQCDGPCERWLISRNEQPQNVLYSRVLGSHFQRDGFAVLA